jgi:membrane protein
MFLLWVYLSWVILLIGAELSFAHQNESVYTSAAQTGQVDQAYREALAPRLAGRIAHAFLNGRQAPTAIELARELGVASRAVTQVLDDLVSHDLLARMARDLGEEERFLPARDPDTITVVDLLHALREERESHELPVKGRLDERTDRLLAAMDEELRKSLHNYTLRELGALVGEESRPDARHSGAEGVPAEHPTS